MKRSSLFIFQIILVVACIHNLSAQQQEFTLSTSYNNLLSNKDGSGFLDVLMQEVFSRIGVSLSILWTETDSSVYDVNAGLIDGEINRISGFEKSYPNLIKVPEANMVMQFVAFAREEYPVSDWDDLADYYIGFVKGWKIIEDNTVNFPHIVTTPTERELFTMLHHERIDIALYSLLTGFDAINKLGFKNIIALDPPLESREMFLYVHKSHKDLIPDIAAALRSIKSDGTYDRIMQSVFQDAF